MSATWINCNHCGKVFSTPDELGSQSVACPECGKQIAVVAPVARPQGASKLQVKHDSTITGGKRCPACESTMASDAVVCTQCGYNTKTGLQYSGASQTSRALQWILCGLGLIVLAGLAKTFLLQDRTGEDQEMIIPPAQQVPGAAVLAAAAATYKTTAANEELAATNEIVAARAGTEIQTAQPPLVASTNNGPVDVIEADYYAALNRRWRAMYPLYAPGDVVVLRKGNGMVHRGALADLKPDMAFVVEKGQTNEIPLKALDWSSRLKCDPIFRAQEIKFYVEKGLKKLTDDRVTLDRQWGARYPLYAAGDAVVLRRGNGLVHRGALADVKSGIVVVVENGQTNEIPLKALDWSSRLKCDPAFRAKEMNSRIQKQIKKPADI